MKSLWDGNTRATYAWPLIRKEIDRVLGPLKPDVIHAHFGPDAVLIAPVAQSRGIPLVVTFYGYDFSIHEVLRRWEDEYRALMRQAAAVIGISDYVCRALVDLGADPSRLACVRLGVEAERFTYSDPASRYDGRTVRCLHVGRLVPKKAPLVLIEAFRTALAEIRDERDLTLTIVGDGSLMPQVRRRVAELGLDGRVQLAGALPRSEVMKLLAGAHIYTQHCVTAPDGDQEGQGVSLVEASAMGLPVISTRHSAIPEVVLDGETGYLVAEHDIEAMGRRIAELARDSSLWTRLGEAGRRHVERYFSLQAETAEALSLLRAAASCHSPQRGWVVAVDRI